MTATQAERFNPVNSQTDFGLLPGDRIRITKGSGVIEKQPNYVEVIEETPLWILCRYHFKHWNGNDYSYRHCLNKHLIAIGDIVFQRAEEETDEAVDLREVG